MKRFFSIFSGWVWTDLIVLTAIVLADNLIAGRDGYWVSLVICFITAVNSIFVERKYKYDSPVNHPSQTISDQDIRGLFAVSISGSLLCIAPSIYGESWIQIFGVFLGIVSVYGIWSAGRLYFITKNHVKYVG